MLFAVVLLKLKCYFALWAEPGNQPLWLSPFFCKALCNYLIKKAIKIAINAAPSTRAAIKIMFERMSPTASG